MSQSLDLYLARSDWLYLLLHESWDEFCKNNDSFLIRSCASIRTSFALNTFTTLPVSLGFLKKFSHLYLTIHTNRTKEMDTQDLNLAYCKLSKFMLMQPRHKLSSKNHVDICIIKICVNQFKYFQFWTNAICLSLKVKIFIWYSDWSLSITQRRFCLLFWGIVFIFNFSI